MAIPIALNLHSTSGNDPVPNMDAWWSNIAKELSNVLGTLETNVSKAQQQRPHVDIHSVNVVMSVVGRGIPKYARLLMSGKFGSNVTVTIYAKMNDLEEEVEYERSNKHVVYGIPNHGHNEYAYFHHMAKRYDNFSDAEVFMKTNELKPNMMHELIDQARSGYWPYNSHPWSAHLNLILFNCDKRWHSHQLYKHLPCKQFYPIARDHPNQEILNMNKSHGSREMSNKSKLGDKIGAATYIRSQGIAHLDRLEQVRPGKLPLVWSGYMEGLFSLYAPLIRQYPKSFYEDVVKDMGKLAINNGTEHDGVICGLIPALFQEEYNRTSKVWAVSPSYVLHRYPDNWATPPQH